jgi:type I pantothenate kinase
MGGDPEGIDPTYPVGTIVRARMVAHPTHPFVVGIAGAVSVGKSTFAEQLAVHLPAPVEILSTDGFLLSNAELEARDLVARKGFPESYDVGLLERSLDAVRAGHAVSVPVYSHETYDIMPAATRELGRPAVLVLEGVNALRFRARIDYGIYLDAPVDAMERWYLARVEEMVAEARPGTFYGSWVGLSREEVRAFARFGWESINVPNLVEHIAPTRAAADLVVEKSPDHAIVGITECTP